MDSNPPLLFLLRRIMKMISLYKTENFVIFCGMKRLLVVLSFCFVATSVAAESVPRPINLIFDDRTINIDFEMHPELLLQEPIHFLRVGEMRLQLNLEQELPPAEQLFDIETEFVTRISPENFEGLLDEMSIMRVQNDVPVIISLDENDEVVFEGSPRDGYEINLKKLIVLMNQAIEEDMSDVRVPARKIFSKVVIDEALQKRGIKEIIAVGESNFAGSSNNRETNIKVGAGKFNGKIVPRWQRFEFNTILDNVDPESGFVPELVIKGNETTKEQGGGLCQVSTTAFRAALTGGLPIVSRRAHSYAVPYYKPYGLDAAIYLGQLDFRFTNDTPGDILIQTFTDEKNLFFVFYGTNDRRIVKLEGPFITNHKPAPDPIVFENENLPWGQTELITPEHDGFDTQWWRFVIKNGVIERENFASSYRAWPARVWKGTGAKEVAQTN